MTYRATLVAAAAAALALAGRASAAACVAIDTDRDTLSEQERAAARSLFLQALERNGQQVSAGRDGAPCTALYHLFNVRLGNSVSVTVAGPHGVRSTTIRVIEDLPNVYDQMVRSLLSGEPISTAGSGVTRYNVTADQAAPRRAEADSLWYARLGYGVTSGGRTAPGPAFGFGYRHELDALGVDLSFVNLTFQHAQGDANVSGSWIRLLAYWFAEPQGNSSAYLGGGVSWGGAAVAYNGTTYSGSGIQGELSAGYEMLRASTIRLFVQADVTLPFYESTTSDFLGTTAAASRYTPTFVLAVGGSFGRSNTIRVNVVP